MRVVTYCTGLLIAVASVTVSVAAQPAPVPEIDGGTIVSGLGLLSGGVLMLKARWKSNR